MTVRQISGPATEMRFGDLDALPQAAPLRPTFKALTDEEAELRAAGDPAAGVIPLGFWDTAQSVGVETNGQIFALCRSQFPGCRVSRRSEDA